MGNHRSNPGKTARNRIKLQRGHARLMTNIRALQALCTKIKAERESPNQRGFLSAQGVRHT